MLAVYEDVRCLLQKASYTIDHVQTPYAPIEETSKTMKQNMAISATVSTLTDYSRVQQHQAQI